MRCLIAVVDEGHFGRAAQRLYISGPALSQQVRKLERALGAELVDRSSHPVHPTVAGECFLSEAREALAAADRAVAAVAAHRRQQVVTLRIGFMTASTGPRLRGILDSVLNDVPGAAVVLTELPWPQQVTAVRDGLVDAALVRPPFSDLRGLRLDLVQHELRVVALPTAHPLAGRDSVDLADLAGEVHVTDDDADPAWVRWWQCDPRPHGTPVRYGPSVTTMAELLEAVASGQAIAITGEFAAATHRHPEVTFVPVSDAEPAQLSLCTRTTDQTPVVAALRRAVHAAHAQMLEERGGASGSG